MLPGKRGKCSTWGFILRWEFFQFLLRRSMQQHFILCLLTLRTPNPVGSIEKHVFFLKNWQITAFIIARGHSEPCLTKASTSKRNQILNQSLKLKDFILHVSVKKKAKNTHFITARSCKNRNNCQISYIPMIREVIVSDKCFRD